MLFSYSRLSTYKGDYGCPYKFYLKYVRQIPEKPSQVLTLGKAVHAAIAAAIKHSSTLYPFCYAVGAAMDVDPNEIYLLADHPYVKEAVRNGGIVEKHFEISLGNDFFAPAMQGYIDYYRVIEDEKVLLWDWKTNYKAYHPAENHQLPLYAAYLQQKYHLPVEGTLIFLRSGEAISHGFTPEEIKNSLAWAEETALEIETALTKMDSCPEKVFPPCPGGACEFCSYSHLCPESEIQEETLTQESAVRLAGEILKLDSKLKAMKENLKAWVETHGPVSVETRTFLIEETSYWKWPPQAQREAVALMQEQGIDPLQVLKITGDSLKTLNWDEDTISRLGAKKVVSRRFECKKV